MSTHVHLMFLLRNEKTSYPDIAVISGIELLMESQNRILLVNFCLDQADSSHNSN